MSDCDVKFGFTLFLIILLLLLGSIHSYSIDKNKEKIKMLEQRIEIINTPNEAKHEHGT